MINTKSRRRQQWLSHHAVQSQLKVRTINRSKEKNDRTVLLLMDTCEIYILVTWRKSDGKIEARDFPHISKEDLSQGLYTSAWYILLHVSCLLFLFTVHFYSTLPPDEGFLICFSYGLSIFAAKQEDFLHVSSLGCRPQRLTHGRRARQASGLLSKDHLNRFLSHLLYVDIPINLNQNSN